MLYSSNRTEEIKAVQGWSEYTVLELALMFIAISNQTKEFEEYLQNKADEENEYGVGI